MNNKLKINVTGGNVAIGATSQGDYSRTHGEAFVTSTELERQFEASKTAVANLASELKRSRAEQDAVIAQLTSLKQITAEQPSKPAEGRAKRILKGIKDNFSWAYPVIKDFVQVAWPALLLVIDR